LPSTIGILLAAGAGSRMGQPKALVAGSDHTPWVVSAAGALGAGGCSTTLVVVGAAGAQVRELLADLDVTIVDSDSWQDGMGSSLRAGLDAAESAAGDAALIHLVDLPDVGPEVIRRMRELSSTEVLARASYGNRPGHPVLIGRDHWTLIAEELTGDSGARSYLQRHGVVDVDCSDLATGVDIDDPQSMLGG
jgi:CTP:molybdopterin cytidylyltransferase MocA